MRRIPNRLEKRLRRLARSRKLRRIERQLKRVDDDVRIRHLLKAVAVTEMSARPADARVIEWTVALVLRSGIMGRSGRARGRTLTVGPWQMRNAPWGLRRTAAVVSRRMRAIQSEHGGLGSDEVARAWHGPATRGQDGPVTYAAVLGRALELVARAAAEG